MTTKIKILGQILAFWDDHFDDFQGKKTCFLDFFKVVLELFGQLKSRLIFILLIPKVLLWGPADALNTEKSAGFWLVSIFFYPYEASKNNFYSPKESSLQNSTEGSHW